MSSHLSAEPLDTSEMATIHTFFRREFRLAGGVVRAVRVGDVARAGEVADHLEYIGRCLHHHHTAEDELAWPILLERVPDELAPIVLLMESQHARADTLLQEIGEVRTTWAESATAADRDRLGDLLDTLYANLAEHLDAEEERMLPIAARALTHKEWRAIGEHARRQTRRSETFLTFGMFQHDGDPEVLARMLSTAPPPARWLVPRLARRAFRRHALRIHGTDNP
jgi:hemerythrin-like domain-containing protein